MANRSKAKGTAFETQVCRYLRERLGDDRIERRALHGSQDLGDLYGLVAHGWAGIVECKSYKQWGRADVLRWRDETEAERLNACADFALLVIHSKGVGEKRTGLNECHMTTRSHYYLLGIPPAELPCPEVLDSWLSMTLAEACQLINYSMGEKE